MRELWRWMGTGENSKCTEQTLIMGIVCVCCYRIYRWVELGPHNLMTGFCRQDQVLRSSATQEHPSESMGDGWLLAARDIS
jgi:Ca2+/H+ antiporter